MINKDVFKIWAPSNKKWVDWVRPVPFIAINKHTKKFQPANCVLPCVSYLDKNDTTTAIIVDLPGTQSVEVGILLTQYGYRPIPIYNGTVQQKGSRATTDNSLITSALVWGASKLSDVELEDDASPAFLTDSNRMHRLRIDDSIFDNSWDVYHQDLPSEEYFIKNDIQKILVISDNLTMDFKKIFAEYTQKKIQIFWTNGYEEPKRVDCSAIKLLGFFAKIAGKEL
jgi:hypothetical protein